MNFAIIDYIKQQTINAQHLLMKNLRLMGAHYNHIYDQKVKQSHKSLPSCF